MKLSRRQRSLLSELLVRPDMIVEGATLRTAYSLYKLGLVHLHSYAWPMMRATITFEGRKQLVQHSTPEDKP